VVVTTLAVSWSGIVAAGVNNVGDISQGLPPLTLPPFAARLLLDLLPAVFLISVVGSANRSRSRRRSPPESGSG
jgi:MFS superfamily sulfate permease-like transporter